MFNVGNNFRNHYKQTTILCPLCKVAEDSQQHLFDCTVLHENIPQKITTIYENIFSSDNDILLEVAKELKTIVAAREEMLSILETEQTKLMVG
jgi:hypothetical protein